MSASKVNRRFATGLTFLLLPLAAMAGRVEPDARSIAFEKSSQIFQAAEVISFTYSGIQYTYGSRKYAYIPLVVFSGDVRKTEALTSARATPGGRIYAVPIDDGSSRIDPILAAAPYKISFPAPRIPGDYTVVVGAVPVFTDRPLDNSRELKQSFEPNPSDKSMLAASLETYRADRRYIALFKVHEKRIGPVVPAPEPPDLYLQVNGGIPGKSAVSDGVSEYPIKFGWYIDPEFKAAAGKFLYRYKIFPEDDGVWGAWTESRDVSYMFLTKGIKQFAVQARLDGPNGPVETRPATFQFSLLRDHVTKPTKATLTKAPIGLEPTSGRNRVSFETVYSKSRALLVGLSQFDDARHFQRFDASKIEADVKAMKESLDANGFEVVVLNKLRLTKEEIGDALASFFALAGRDDRLFVYFSTHGFADPKVAAEGYLATSDCSYDLPLARCFRLNDLNQHADRALLGNSVKQVLFAVDSCFAGLGVVQKAAPSVDLTRLAATQGAFLMTAGMASQLAHIDEKLGMSTFTYYLAEGLRGKAHLLDTNAMTLTELFLYVQYEVAKRTDSKQIPMLGRLKGDGEMLFRPPVPFGTMR